MDFPNAKFIKALYSDEEVNRMELEFQEKGYTILRNVFERESVKEYKAQLQEAAARVSWQVLFSV